MSSTANETWRIPGVFAGAFRPILRSTLSTPGICQLGFGDRRMTGRGSEARVRSGTRRVYVFAAAFARARLDHSATLRAAELDTYDKPHQAYSLGLSAINHERDSKWDCAAPRACQYGSARFTLRLSLGSRALRNGGSADCTPHLAVIGGVADYAREMTAAT